MDTNKLFQAIHDGENELALQIISGSVEGTVDLSLQPQHDKNGNNPIMAAFLQDMETVTEELIISGEFDLGFVNELNGNTLLILACKKKENKLALELIETGQSNPGQVNKEGNTALIHACDNNMPEVAIALIQTGQSKPDQVNIHNNTALIWACYNNMPEVAIALIKTGKSKPDQINTDGNTALMFACYNKMSEVAIALIQTGQSKPEQIDNYGNTALIYAKKNGMTNVLQRLKINIEKIIEMNLEYYHALEARNCPGYYVLKTGNNSEHLRLDKFSVYLHNNNIRLTKEMNTIAYKRLALVDIAQNKFCGPNMDSEYLYHSLMNNNYYALLRLCNPDEHLNIINRRDASIHSIITFKFIGVDKIYVDAFCVNQVRKYKGGGVLLNRLFDICILCGVNTIELQAVDTPDTVNFYKKMGFIESSIPDEETELLHMAGLLHMTNAAIVSEPRKSFQDKKYQDVLEEQEKQEFQYLQEMLEYEKDHTDDENSDAEEETLMKMAHHKMNILNIRRGRRKLTFPKKYSDYEFVPISSTTLSNRENEGYHQTVPISEYTVGKENTSKKQRLYGGKSKKCKRTKKSKKISNKTRKTKKNK